MTLITRLFIWVYAVLLRLYPQPFRDQFGEEMQRVFRDTLADAAARGRAALLWVCWRELCDLPGALLLEHWRRRKRMMDNGPGVPWIDLLVPAIPFLLYLALPLGKGLGSAWIGAAILLIPVVLIIVLIAGLFRGLPRWSLPALGLSLAVLNSILFGLVDPNFDPLASAPAFLRLFLGAGFHYFGIILLVLMVIVASAAVKPWRPFFERMRRDWTLLPFALYGMMPLVMFMSFDEYHGDAPYQVGMGAIWLVSLWLYLRGAQPKRRMLMLAIGIMLAMGVDVTGKWMLVPVQVWPRWFAWHPVPEATLIEVTSTLYHWFWVMVVVFLPALLGFLSPSRPHEPASP